MVTPYRPTHVLKRDADAPTEARRGKFPHVCMGCFKRFLDPLDGIGEYCPAFKDPNPRPYNTP